MARNPKSCVHLFLPTMDQDETLEAKAAVKDATMWYKCANGHAYAIGNCGQPVEAGTCPSCGSPVGGARYAFANTGLNVQQVGQALLNDSTKPGHLLGEAKANDRSNTVREISGLAVAIIRFLLHASMLEGSRENLEDVAKLIQPKVNQVSML
jgi:hypothetical protein